MADSRGATLCSGNAPIEVVNDAATRRPVSTRINPRWGSAPIEQGFVWNAAGPPAWWTPPQHPWRFANVEDANAFLRGDLSKAVPTFITTYDDGTTAETW